MSTHNYYCLYSKDEKGRFTISCDREFGTQYFSAEDAKAFNAKPIVYRHWEGLALPSSEYQYGRWRDPSWRDRERARGYEALPWPDLEPIPDHFAHVSVEKTTMVAFTPNPEKGELDIQVRMNPGRYLTKFYPHLEPDQVRLLACELDRCVQVRFGSTADDFERVYLNGPNSCMSHGAHCYRSPFHPVRVYAAGDLQIAYLSADDVKTSSRCLVWPAKMIYGRIYGDEDRMGNALRNLGYTDAYSDEDCPFEGARLVRHAISDDFLVAPYIDGECHRLRDGGDYLIIDPEGSMEADSTSGTCKRPSRRYCPRRDVTFHENEVGFYYVRDVAEYWCAYAVDEDAFYCHYYEDYFSNEFGFVELSDGTIWSRRAFENHGHLCPETGRNERRAA